MFHKILIANRGEIAVRVIRACRDMGIVSVAVYSEADRDAMHANIADESVCIGPAPSHDSYLNMDAIIEAALATGADAVHPGYGFLSENSEFVRRCGQFDIAFIGPPSVVMDAMGDKAEAKRTAQMAGVPVIPGSDGPVSGADDAVRAAHDAGFPVMLKAVSGGGGRGIRRLDSEEALRAAYDTCAAEAEANFGDGRLYVEKCIEQPRHIEIQILADGFGNVLHLFERDCTIQRRHQKLVEESPSMFVDEELRQRMGAAAVRAAKAAGYVNAGTIEFLVDKDKNFYFMEMNARIQVEHPVTETVTGVDLVGEQIRVAAGEPLTLRQQDLVQRGHAIECRINAEDPLRNFAPSPGRIREMNVPGGLGVRVDCAIYQGYLIPPYYDSLIAKLIVHGRDRTEALARMRRALVEMLFDGIVTNTDFHLLLLSDPRFIAGDYDNGFLDKYGDEIIAKLRGGE